MKIQQIIFLIIFVGGLLTSCYEDESSLNYKLINPINIDLGSDDATEFSIFAYDTLVIKPMVYREGTSDANLSFKWTISGFTLAPVVLDSTMTLKKIIELQPQALPYDLLFQVTDHTTGIIQEQSYKVTVQTPFGSGLVVSETRDDITSDISLIRSYYFSGGFKKGQDTTMRNLFSLVNKRKIGGVGKAILSSSYGVYGRFLTIGTDRSIDRVDPFDYSYIDGNGNSFMIDPKNYDVSSLGFSSSAGAMEALVIGGKVYTHALQSTVIHTYSYYLLTNDMSDYRISLLTLPIWAYGLCFDELNGRFLEISGTKRLRVIDSKKLDSDAPFDPNKLQNFTCRAMFSGKNDIGHNILQEKDPLTGKPKADGNVYCYDTKQAQYYDDPTFKNGMPSKVMDLSNFEGVKGARFFTGTNNRDYIYYATSNKIYTIDLTMNKATEDYTVENPNEEITSMAVWLGSGLMSYTNNKGDIATTGSNNNMLVVTTYNSITKEGFVRTLPIAIFSGRIEQNKELHDVYGGFGKITATSTQK